MPWRLALITALLLTQGACRSTPGRPLTRESDRGPDVVVRVPRNPQAFEAFNRPEGWIDPSEPELVARADPSQPDAETAPTDPPARTEPVPPEPALPEAPEDAAPVPEPEPTPAPSEPVLTPPVISDAEWWLREPEPVAGRLRAVSHATDPSVRAARSAAVEAGVEALRARLGAEPRDVRVEQATAVPDDAGGYRFYVLVSCAG